MPEFTTYIDGDFAVAKATSLPVFESPLPGIKDSLILRQNFTQNLADFTPLDLNTPHPDNAEFVLVEETSREDTGGGVVAWTRIYAKVPDAYSEPGGNIAYQFIGFYGNFGINVTTITGRDRFVPPGGSAIRLHREFFLCGPGETYETGNDIPIIPEQQYYINNPRNITDYLADSPPFTVASTPTRTEYEAMIEAGDEIVAQASIISRWMGNIFLRETRYIVAQ
jgi:hypothetical protein